MTLTLLFACNDCIRLNGCSEVLLIKMCGSMSRNAHFQRIRDHFWSGKTIQILAYSSGFLFNGSSYYFVTSAVYAKFATHMLFCTLGYHAYVAQHKQYCLLAMIASDRITVVRYRWQGTCGKKSGKIPLQYDEVLEKWTQSRYFQSGLIRFKPETSEYGRLKKASSVSRLWAGQLRKHGLIPRSKRLVSFPKQPYQFRGPPRLIFMGSGNTLPSQIGMLTTHFHVVLRLRISKTTTLLHLCPRCMHKNNSTSKIWWSGNHCTSVLGLICARSWMLY